MARRSRGFTLIEILVSLLIIGGLLLTIVTTINYHLAAAARHETLTVAQMLGREKLTELAASPAAASGVFNAPYADYAYESAVEPSPYPGISVLKVTVRAWGEEVYLRELVR